MVAMTGNFNEMIEQRLHRALVLLAMVVPHQAQSPCSMGNQGGMALKFRGFLTGRWSDK